MVKVVKDPKKKKPTISIDIRQKEKRRAELIKKGAGSKGAGETASREQRERQLTKNERTETKEKQEFEKKVRDEASTPEAIANKSLDIEEAKSRLRRERLQIDPVSNQPIEEETQKKESLGSRIKETVIGQLKGESLTGDVPVRSNVVPFGVKGLGLGFGKKGISSILSLKNIGNINLAADIGKKTSKLVTLRNVLIGGFTLNELVLSPNELHVWTAVDNIGSAIPFQLNDVIKGVQSGDITREEAIVLVEQAEKHLENARKFITISTIFNPKLWAGAKRLIEANIVAREAVDRKKDLLGID